MANSFEVGARVKRSEHSIRPKRDYWLGCGREPMKSGAKDALDKAIAERGTIIKLGSNPNAPIVLVVKLDSGSVESSLPYQWELDDYHNAF